MQLLFLLSIISQFMGGYHLVDTMPGSEAFRLASYTIMMLRDECKKDHCAHLSTIEMYNVSHAQKQVVNGVKMKIQTHTTNGILDINIYYDNVYITSFLNKGLPSLVFNITDFENIAPPCNVGVNKCHSFLFFPTCANGITYANPCYANEACRIDLSSGPCV